MYCEIYAAREVKNSNQFNLFNILTLNQIFL